MSLMIGNIKEFMNDPTLRSWAIEKEPFHKDNGRTRKKKIADILFGVAAEKVYTTYKNIEHVTEDYSRYDGIGDYKYEIKHMRGNVREPFKFWSYKSDHYKYFFDSAKKGLVDKIVLVFVDTQTGNTYLKFEADAKTFAYYSNPTQYNNSNWDYYYKHSVAARDNKCIIF